MTEPGGTHPRSIVINREYGSGAPTTQQFFTQTTFGDPRAYDLCLNSARLGFEGCVETILTTTQTGGSQPR